MGRLGRLQWGKAETCALLLHHHEEIVDSRQFLPIDVDRGRRVDAEAMRLGDLGVEPRLGGRRIQAGAQAGSVEPRRGGDPLNGVPARILRRLREHLVVVLPEPALLARAQGALREQARARMYGLAEAGVARFVEGEVLEVDRDPPLRLWDEVTETARDRPAERAQE